MMRMVEKNALSDYKSKKLDKFRDLVKKTTVFDKAIIKSGKITVFDRMLEASEKFDFSEHCLLKRDDILIPLLHNELSHGPLIDILPLTSSTCLMATDLSKNTD